MLRFKVYQNGSVPKDVDLSTAYLVGSDNVPIRGEFFYQDGEIVCRKRATGPAALSLMWPSKTFGAIMLETTRLAEREEPYLLNLELARSRMMRIMQKREEWGLMEVPEAQIINDKINECRDLLIEAIVNTNNMVKAADYADQCLATCMPLSEQMALLHAELLLTRRLQAKGLPRGAFGVRVDPNQNTEGYRKALAPNADFIQLPATWKAVEPTENQFEWRAFDEWIEICHRVRMPVVGGPLVSFTDETIPGWLYMWEHDYETVRDLLYEHTERVVSRYGAHVVLWNVVSGLHVNGQFSFTFDQIMDLTRMAVGLVRKLNPKSRTMIELTQPFGEYYSQNQRSIPPLLYAEMVVQSGISFDVFGLQLRFGVPRDGHWMRDLFQISCLLDRFAPLGKPLVITGIQAPSMPPGEAMGGSWHQNWSPAVQAKWMEALMEIALSKPYVEAISWWDLADNKAENAIPYSGLVGADLKPKLSQATWANLRKVLTNLRSNAGKPPTAETNGG